MLLSHFVYHCQSEHSDKFEMKTLKISRCSSSSPDNGEPLRKSGPGLQNRDQIAGFVNVPLGKN